MITITEDQLRDEEDLADVPGADDDKWDFQLDERGVYQIYADLKGKHRNRALSIR